MTLKIWKVKYIFTVEFKKGIFRKKKVEVKVISYDDMLIIAEDKYNALTKAESGRTYRLNIIPKWSYDEQDSLILIPENVVVLGKTAEVSETSGTLEFIKNHTYSNEFLAYCRQELYGSHPEGYMEDFIQGI